MVDKSNLFRFEMSSASFFAFRIQFRASASGIEYCNNRSSQFCFLSAIGAFQRKMKFCAPPRYFAKKKEEFIVSILQSIAQYFNVLNRGDTKTRNRCFKSSFYSRVHRDGYSTVLIARLYFFFHTKKIVVVTDGPSTTPELHLLIASDTMTTSIAHAPRNRSIILFVSTRVDESTASQQ